MGQALDDFPLDTILAFIGIVVPLAAFLWEFVFVGRRRLGYRVQMDTPVTGEIGSVYPGVLERLHPDPAGTEAERREQLRELSVVLVRIENSGNTAISESDYLSPSQQVGLHLHFPQRRVIGMAVTELSDRDLAPRLGPASGIAINVEPDGRTGVIDLPKVPLIRNAHYKILAILQRGEGNGDRDGNGNDQAPDPVLRGDIRGGSVVETRSRTGISRVMLLLTVFLVLVIIGQFVVDALQPPPPPLDCAAGKLTLVGSSAFDPVIRDAAAQYEKRCTAAEFAFDFEGTERGLDRVAEAGRDSGLLTISDGAKGPGYTALQARPLALSMFAVVVHRDLGVTDLTVAQVRDLYRGRITNWREVGGPDVPVVLIDRAPGSGTRVIFEDALLGGAQPARPHRSCTAIKDTAGTYCDVPVTKDMHKAVGEIPGAIGYSELSEARRADMRVLTLGGVAPGRQAAIDRSYPFWGVEYAYSNGDLPGDSLAASFLHYLTADVGAEVLRAHGNEPCASDLLEPGRCTPAR
ncbi:ABC-type phosphate transport system, substrate-binding protein [Nocardia amikacinitolerans]|uniref:ABC-type phosphate transport system, substrate-binding protein n=1 Tax=Nocardia amikacinitolerans TaxID=756689 RepID=A0A285LUD8_9NOCA|nr:substrate-binding domain-containing protein [Nocardia amikacinitolerans]SNY88522.1 ABC-type phosphate transport system, substrate-binding protein [Nocardia amikacinitolerans]